MKALLRLTISLCNPTTDVGPIVGHLKTRSLHGFHDQEEVGRAAARQGRDPAYFFLVMELMEEAGGRLGLPAETSRLLTLETAFGAAKMALESAEDPAGLRRRVTSPGGTTARAVQHLEDNGLRSIFQGAMEAARDRAAEIGQELGTK